MVSGTRLADVADMLKHALPSVLLVACVSSTDPEVTNTLHGDQLEIDTARFTTATSIAANAAPNVDVTVTGDAARAVFATTIALPQMPSEPISCPIDFGITYTIEFSAHGQRMVEATIEPSGCQQVSLSTADGTDWAATDAAYWPTLASDLGIPEAKIYPYVPN